MTVTVDSSTVTNVQLWFRKFIKGEAVHVWGCIIEISVHSTQFFCAPNFFCALKNKFYFKNFTNGTSSTTYKIPTGNIILNGKRLNAFPLTAE